MSAHGPGEDGLCAHSDLPPNQCAGCTGTEDPAAPALRRRPPGTFAALVRGASPGASRERHERYYGESTASATKAYEPWGRGEDEQVLARAVPDRVLSERLGRSLHAIEVRRARLIHGMDYR